MSRSKESTISQAKEILWVSSNPRRRISFGSFSGKIFFIKFGFVYVQSLGLHDDKADSPLPPIPFCHFWLGTISPPVLCSYMTL